MFLILSERKIHLNTINLAFMLLIKTILVILIR